MFARLRIVFTLTIACLAAACDRPARRPKSQCCKIAPERDKCSTEIEIGLPKWEIRGTCECERNADGQPVCHTGVGLLAD